jgi:Cytochrome c oxidase subunit IV.
MKTGNAADDEATPAKVPPGWTPLPMEHLPAPTAWPAGFALAIALFFWGLIASWVLIAIGGILLIASLAGWIGDIRHDRHHPHA